MRNLAVFLGVVLVLFGRGDLPEPPGSAEGRRATGDGTPGDLVEVHGDGSASGGAAPIEGTRLVADTGGPLREIVLHFDPDAEADVAPAYRDLLGALPPTVAIRVAVASPRDGARFRELAEAWGVRVPSRIRIVEVGRPITTWARDRYALLARRAGPGGRPERVLLVRPRPDRAHAARVNDWLAPFAIARAADADARAAGEGRVRVAVSPLVFDGGDLLAARAVVLATPLLLDRNRETPLRDARAAAAYLRRVTAKEVVFLGQRPEEVPPHHIGMFVTALGDEGPGRPWGTLLVGDPALGLRQLTPAAEAALPQKVERDPAFLARFERVATAARRAGFRVVRTPLVPLVDHLTYVTYNNALLERRADGRLHAYVPRFGLPALDAAGRAVFEAEGVVVHPIDVSRIYRHNGTVRCLVNVLSRG